MARMRSLALPIALAIAALAGAAAGCGSDDESASETTTTTTRQATPYGAVPDGGSEASVSAGDGVLTGSLPLLNGTEQDLSRYRGRVVLVVNTASECGFTSQFEGLEELFRERRRDGFVVLGFPADDVAGQEPRSDEEIAEFCEANFGVSFPMFAKSNVVSEPVNPLFERLAEAAGAPAWNFNKYLIDREGAVVGRFDAGVAPDDPELESRIDALL